MDKKLAVMKCGHSEVFLDVAKKECVRCVELAQVAQDQNIIINLRTKIKDQQTRIEQLEAVAAATPEIENKAKIEILEWIMRESPFMYDIKNKVIDLKAGKP